MTLTRIEMLMSYVLRIGVGVSLAVIVTGLVMAFVHHPGFMWSSDELASVISPQAAEGNVPTVSGVLAGVMAGRGQALIMLGLALLVATPVARVAVSVVVFALQKEWVFVGITVVVLLALAAGFWMGAAG